MSRTAPIERLGPAALHNDAKDLKKPRVLWFNVGWMGVAAAAALSVLGVVAIGTTEPGLAIKQTLLLAVGVVGAAVVAAPHYRWARRLSYALLASVLALLVFVLIPWVPDSIVHPRNGARRWINLFVTDIQPSELAKIAYVLAMANYLRYRKNHRRFLGLLLPLAATFVPLGLVLVEPDLGTAMLFLPTFFAMVVAAGAKLRHVILIVALGLAAAPTLYPVLQPHQKNRIRAMIAQIRGDTSFDKDIGYQGARAMTLVGAGGLVGVGKSHARDLVVHNQLPEEHNDMIFAVICCRWGLLGGLTVWAGFLVLAATGLIVAGMCKEPFGRLVAVGVVSILLAQMTINTGMTIGVLPITGMTLPFVSAGGSSLVANWIMVGLLLNIAMRRPAYLLRKSFEWESDEADA